MSYILAPRAFRIGSIAVVCSVLIACETALAPEPICDEGDVRGCQLASGCLAQRTCTRDGLGFGSCMCIDEGDASVAKLSLGAVCTGDDECPPTAFCLTASSDALYGGRPTQGTCVADCTDSQRCDRYANASCVRAGDRSLCFEACQLGTGTADRCHARKQTACEPLTGTSGYCRPICSSDADCETGHCDPKHGVCVSQGTAGEPDFGKTCTSTGDAEVASCSGLCVDVPQMFEVCSHRCVFGESSDCSLLAGIRGGCVVATPGGSIGDVGYCAPLCDADVDCSAFGRSCDLFKEGVLEAAFGKKGACTVGAAAGAVP